MKTTILFISALFVGQIFAQQMTLCEALGGLGEHATNSFVNLRGEVKESSALLSSYDSKISITEALSTEVDVSLSKTEWIVDYGQFNSESEALSKVVALKSNLTACFPNVRFSDYSYDILKSRKSHLIQEADIGFRYFSAHFKIEKWSDKFRVSFRYPAVTEGNFMNAGDPGFKDFYFISTAQGYDQFSQDIRSLIVKGESGFADIKGEEKESNHYLFQDFYSNFQVSGMSSCYIEDRTMNFYNYVMPVATGVDEATIRAISEEYIEKLLTALGSDYAFFRASNGLEINYVHKNLPSIEVVNFVVEFNDGAYDLTIFIPGHIED